VEPNRSFGCVNDGHGGFEYAGETKIYWDEQKSLSLRPGTIELLCHQGHQWTSDID
jgi:hypothetical protein